MVLTEGQFVCQLLCEEKAAYLQYEKETQSILVCDINEIELHVARRQELIHRIDQLDAQIKERCDADEVQGELAYQAVKCKCDKDRLPENLEEIFYAGQEIFAVANRIREMDIQATERIKLEQSMLLEKIKANNQSIAAKASKYYNAAASRESMVLNSKYAKA